MNFNLVHSQEKVFNFKCNQKSRLIKKRTFSLSNHVNGDLTILIKERNTVFAYLFDQDFNKKQHFSFDFKKKKRFNALLGYSVKGTEYSLIYTDNSTSKFLVATIDFDKGKNKLQEIELNFNKEKYLKTISHNNNLYVLSSTKQNKLIIRLLDDNYRFKIVKEYFLELDKEQKIQLSLFSFSNFNLSINTQSSNITKIDNRVPNALEKATQDNKVFTDEDNLYLFFDNKTASTLMYQINLNNFSIERKEFLYPVGKIDDYSKYNSYYVDGILFQIASSRQEMSFIISDIDGKLLKLYYFDKETPLHIKNTPIIQEKEIILPFDGKRELEKTSKFLRKISSGKVGLCVLQQHDGYHLTIGGVTKTQGSSGGFSTTPVTTTLGGNGSGQIASITTFNPTYSGYSSYTSTKSTYFNTKLDFEFNHIQEKASTTVFEKIEDYKKSLKYVSTEDIFFHKDQLFFGYFNMKEGVYELIKF
ncbi:hypothetical protein MHTCC0001_01530 [Flavobacteriaceae bacterium MHTCC 0001]